MTPELRNWSGTYQFTARKVIAARTIGEVQRVVAAGGRLLRLSVDEPSLEAIYARYFQSGLAGVRHAA